MESSSLCLRLLISLRCSFIRSEPTTKIKMMFCPFSSKTNEEHVTVSLKVKHVQRSDCVYLCYSCLTGTPKIPKTGRLRLSPAGCRKPYPTMQCSPADWPQLSWPSWCPDRCCWRLLALVSGSCWVVPHQRKRKINHTRGTVVLFHDLLGTIICRRWQIITVITDIFWCCPLMRDDKHKNWFKKTNLAC